MLCRPSHCSRLLFGGGCFTVRWECFDPSCMFPTQIDLSDDYVCLMMFADGAWEEQMAPISYADPDNGKEKQLKVGEWARCISIGSGSGLTSPQHRLCHPLPNAA